MNERKRKASAAARWAGSFCGLWLLSSVLLFAACRDSVGTALYVTIDFPPNLLMDQLLVSGTVAGMDFGPHVLPEQPERLLANGDTFRVLLPPVPDNSEAELIVEGLARGAGGTRHEPGGGPRRQRGGCQRAARAHSTGWRDSGWGLLP